MDADYDDLRDILFQVSSFLYYFLEWRSKLRGGKTCMLLVISKNRLKEARESMDKQRLILSSKTH
jgi:hypothetical protein